MGVALLPLLWLQGRQVRQKIPTLPEAAPPFEGLTGSQDKKMHILVMGESTAAGVGAKVHDVALAGQLARYLSLNLKQTVAWQAIGQNGLKSQGLLHQLFPEKIKPVLQQQPVDLIVISMGVNDAKGFTPRQQWKQNIKRVIMAIRQYSDATIFLTGAPPLEQFPELPKPLSSVLGARARIISRQLDDLCRSDIERVHYLPMNPGLNDGDLASDGFHPSEQAYASWGEQLSSYYQRLI
ncbi:SGNH/GDSL hydrolase family protein [Spongorhabdus nitratireducens]